LQVFLGPKDASQLEEITQESKPNKKKQIIAKPLTSDDPVLRAVHHRIIWCSAEQWQTERVCDIL
jgi:hypothetical protein